MEAHEIKTDADLVLFVRERCLDPELFAAFEEGHPGLMELVMQPGLEVSITEGVVDATRPDGTPARLMGIQVVYMVDPTCAPGYTFVFGEGDQVDKIIMIEPRDPFQPFERLPPVVAQ